MVWVLRLKKEPRFSHLATDSDWGGNSVKRKSTSGGAIAAGNHPVKTWSTTQNVISLSSGEAEYYGLAKGVSVGVRFRGVLGGLGIRGMEVKQGGNDTIGR